MFIYISCLKAVPLPLLKKTINYKIIKKKLQIWLVFISLSGLDWGDFVVGIKIYKLVIHSTPAANCTVTGVSSDNRLSVRMWESLLK